MMGSEVDLAVESILSKDCSADMVDVDVPEPPNFVTELANSLYQHRTSPSRLSRSSYSPSNGQQGQLSTETTTTTTTTTNATTYGLPISNDVLNTPPNVKCQSQTEVGSSSSYFQCQPELSSLTNATMAPSSCKPVDVDDSDVVHSISHDFIEEAILGVVFDVHRAAKCGLMFLLNKAAQNADKYKIVDEFRTLNNNVTDIFGQTLGSGRSAKLVQQVDCFCPECNQPTAACRFAPHLEKCMGMGRNSFRKARTRLAASSNAASHHSTASGGSTTGGGGGHYSSSVKNSSSSKITSYNNRNVVKNSWSDVEDVEGDDDDDDWVSTRKKGQQRKRLVPKNANKKKVRNTPIKKKQSSSFLVSSQSSSMLSNQLLEDSNSNAAILLSDLLDTPPLYVTSDDKANRSRDSPMFSIGESRRCQKLPDEDDDDAGGDYLDFDVPSPSL